MRHSTRATLVASLAALALLAPTAPVTAAAPSAARSPAPQAAKAPPKSPFAVGRGGAVSSVDPNATRIGLRVLRNGGNAVDAAVATAAALGVTEPYSAGLGGGGFFVFYDAKSGRVRTLDGRETAPAAMRRNAFIDPESPTGEPYNFTPELVTSGVSVGVPGTLSPGSARSTAGAPAAWRSRCCPPPGWPSAGSGSTGPSTSRPPTTRCGSTRSGPPGGCSCRVASRPPSARGSATPTWRAPTGCSPTRGSRRSTPARSPARSSPPYAVRRRPPTPTCRCRAAT